MVEWSITTDCKSVGFGLRRFESFPAHKLIMENIPNQPVNLERYYALKDKFNRYIEEADPDFVDSIFMEIFPELQTNLLAKYPKATSYAFFHILGGSTINNSIGTIEHEDFPGEDSVELFIDNLMNQK